MSDDDPERQKRLEKLERRIDSHQRHLENLAQMPANNYAASAWIMDRKSIDGISLSDRIWTHAAKTAEEVKHTILLNLQAGNSARRVRDQLMQTQEQVAAGIPKWLQKELDLASPKSIKDKVERYMAKKVKYNAMRVARTEIQRAFRGSYMTLAKKLDFVTHVKWNLSGSHFHLMPEGDICTDIAETDNGQGPGVYPKDAVPFDGGPAHPHCMCNLTTVIQSMEDTLAEELAEMDAEA